MLDMLAVQEWHSIWDREGACEFEHEHEFDQIAGLSTGLYLDAKTPLTSIVGANPPQFRFGASVFPLACPWYGCNYLST